MRGKLHTFTYTFDKQFHLGNKNAFILVRKRNLLPSAHMFFFERLLTLVFIKNFFRDTNVLSSVQKIDNGGNWKCIGTNEVFVFFVKVNNRLLSKGKPAERVEVQDVDCTLLSVDIFDRLYRGDIVRDNGEIRKCFDEYYEEIQISDELRKMLLIEDSDNYDLYTDKERNEFLFRLFKHLCLGAYCCQFEDEVKPYIEVTRSVYKDLVR
jgi:hypothetical protein